MSFLKKRIMPFIAHTAINFRRKQKFLLVTLLTVFSLSSVFAQQGIAVSGIVRDSAGAPIPQSTVSEKGKKNATTTNAEGKFSLTVADSRAVLLITSVGYAPMEIAVGNQTNINISLEQQKVNMEEVVVIGYGTKRKESLTGAISSITAKDMDRVHGGSTVSSG
ncbi:MAG TPA: carboxypeptidase-like regulatory domain-containing protein, partial [Lacibacter sp.]|nr:carboxypeptidase-like regulatory domain-containing protein [Lacibacter sp.]